MPYAITPYNFVELPDRILAGEAPPAADRYHAGRHTGWFEITLTALTPIYTRAAKNPAEYDPRNPDRQPVEFFQRQDGTPVLPGSGLRGMVRSLFEIITCSQMEFVSQRRLFFRSFASTARNWADYYRNQFEVNRLVAGVLRKSNELWYLDVSDQTTCNSDPDQQRGFLALPVNDAKLTSVADVEGGKHPDLYNASGRWRASAPVYRAFEYGIQPLQGDVTLLRPPHDFQVAKCTVSASDTLRGWVMVPGPVIRPRHYWQVILRPSTTGRSYPVPGDVMEDYENWGAMAHGSRFGTPRAPRRLKEGEPAFALLDGTDANAKVAVVGANMMMALRYQNSIKKVAERSLPAPDLDMAQAVFGRVRDQKTGREDDQIRGRVFFEDAVCGQTVQEAYFDTAQPVKVPDILSGPKPTAFQTYLEQPHLNRLIHWDDPDDPKIRGHKLYWHRSGGAARAALRNERPSNESESQVTRISPLRAGVVFTGRVRFENLTDAELGALYAALQLPAGLAHKFGMGKNLGLGSLRVEVTGTTLLEMRERLLSLDPDTGTRTGEVARGTLGQAYEAFVRRLSPNARSLWSGRRMLALAALLSWDGKPADQETQQIGFSDQWKYRWTLPEPRRVAAVQGVADVLPLSGTPASTEESRVASRQAPPVESPRRQDAPPPARTDRPSSPDRSPAPRPKYQEGDTVSGRIVRLNPNSGLGSVELMDGTRVEVDRLFFCNEGETYSFRVVKVGGDGLVKALRRK